MGFIDIIKGFFALIFLQASWSYVGRQTLGFLYAIILLAKNKSDTLTPAPTKSQIEERIWQKFSLNTNPYCTGVMIGIALNHEGEIFKESYFSLQHIFGSIGDEFFWHLLRPTLLSLAVLLLLLGYFYSNNLQMVTIFTFAPLLFFIPYNIIAQGTRIRGLYQGKKYGKSAAIFLIQDLRRFIPKLYNTLAFISGALLILLLLANSVGRKYWSIPLILFLTILSYRLLRSDRASSYLLIVGLLIFLIIKLL